MSEYSDLQKKASGLGLEKVVGLPKEKLIEFIKSKENSAEPEENKTTANKDWPTPAYNMAIIYRGQHKVREYTLENHGEDFKSLAEEYLSHHTDCTVKYEDSSTLITCPNCRTKFRPKAK